MAEITEDETKDWQLHSIYKLPACVTHLNRDAYRPLTISFGPYHYGKPSLLRMEAHKCRALERFLGRSGKPRDSFFVQIFESLRKVVKDLEGAYDSLDNKWKRDSDAFLELMMRDGCFILEFLRAVELNSVDYVDEEFGARTDDYAPNDPIFGRHGLMNMMLHIQRDMLILENQLPMLLLTKLISADDQAKREVGESYIYKLVLHFCDPIHKTGKEELGKCKHILDVVRKGSLWSGANGNGAKKENDEGGDGIVPCAKKENDEGGNGIDTGAKKEKDEGGDGDGVIPSATELQESGIKITTSETRSFKDITFQDGILRLPQLWVSDTTGSVLLNLMAFERFHAEAGNDVTSYVLFMDDLIRDARDVMLLHRCNIISHPYGSNHRAVAQFFRSLSKNIPIFQESDNLSALRMVADQYCSKKLIQYYKRPLNRCWINFVNKYFRNPWSFIALFAAVLAFGLTIVQTIYTIIQTLYTIRQYKQGLHPNH